MASLSNLDCRATVIAPIDNDDHDDYDQKQRSFSCVRSRESSDESKKFESDRLLTCSQPASPPASQLQSSVNRDDDDG